MTSHEFALVDVFADVPLAGNPLAVVTGADDLDEGQMAAIAVEFNLSETTFVSRPTRDRALWRLRSFTPGGEEVVGAGHNALGAWWRLVESGRAEPPGAVQELGGRLLPVRIDRDPAGPVTIGLEQGPVELDLAPVDTDALVGALSPGRRVALDPGIELSVGSVGSPHLLVAVTTCDEVDALRPDQAALRDVLAVAGAQGCYVYSLDAGGHGPGIDAYARFFNPTVGITEDPATGSAAGPLAALLAATGRVRDSATVLQGVLHGRPSVLRVQVGAHGAPSPGGAPSAPRGGSRHEWDEHAPTEAPAAGEACGHPRRGGPGPRPRRVRRRQHRRRGGRGRRVDQDHLQPLHRQGRPFREVVAESTARVAEAEEALVREHSRPAAPRRRPRPALTAFARAWVRAATGEDRTHQLLLRQLAAEAQHLPRSVVEAWRSAGPRRVRHELALRLRALADRGELLVGDAERSAVLFAQLVAAPQAPSAPARLRVRERDDWVEEAVRIFLAGHRLDQSPGTPNRSPP